MKYVKKILMVICLLFVVYFTAEIILPVELSNVVIAEDEIQQSSIKRQDKEKESEKSKKLKIMKEDFDSKPISYEMHVGETLKLTSPKKLAIKWSSSDEKVAIVNRKGVVTAKKVGKATITGKFGSKTIKVKLNIKSIIIISDKKVTLKVKQKKEITVRFLAYGILTNIVMNSSVVKADWGSSWDGNTIKLYLTGLKEGSTTVKITNSVNTDTATIKVTVKKNGSNVPSSSAKYRALLIRNYNYSDDPLYSTSNNISTMKGMLTKSLKTKYTVTTKTNLTATGIKNAISSAFSGATDKDVSLFYYSGHGLVSYYDYYSRTGSLCGVDDSYLTPKQLSDALSKVPGKVIVILDCCHSGACITKDGSLVEGNPADFNDAIVDNFSGYTYIDPSEDEQEKNGELRKKNKFIVLTACTMQETAVEKPYYGVFTRALIEGLGCQWGTGTNKGSIPADSNNDHVVSVYECKVYITKKTPQLTTHSQHCMYYGSSTYQLFKMK